MGLLEFKSLSLVLYLENNNFVNNKSKILIDLKTETLFNISDLKFYNQLEEIEQDKNTVYLDVFNFSFLTAKTYNIIEYNKDDFELNFYKNVSELNNDLIELIEEYKNWKIIEI